MEKDLNQIKTEILSRVDIKSTYESLGIVFTGPPNSSGWVPCRSPYSPDKHPSCGVNISSGSHRGFLCAFNTNGSKGKPYAAFSFWDIAGDFLPGAGGDFKYVIRHYAKKTGVEFKSNRKPPTTEMVKEFMLEMPESAATYLREKRGLSPESIKKYEIGFRKGDKRNTFPVYDSDRNLLNIRYHNSKLKPKTLNHAGFGSACLWGAERLAQQPPGAIVTITEGEFDSMLVEQETGLCSVSPTNGKNAFDRSWVPMFHGLNVALVWDCDEPGRRAVEKVILPAFQEAIVSGDVLSIKVVWLYKNLDAPKDEKDFTDYITKSGGSGAKLLKLIKNTPVYKYSKEAIDNPPPDPDQFFDGKTFTPSDMIDYILKTNIIFHDGCDFYQYDKAKGFYLKLSQNILSREIKRALGRRVKAVYIKDTLFMLKGDCYKTLESQNPYPNMINMLNGMMDLENGKFIPHDKKYLSRIQIPIKFDKGATCPRWMQFLEEVFSDDPGKAKTLQDFSGYCFTHEIPFEKCLFLIGKGANGKSVFIKTLTDIVGVENTSSLDPSMFSDKFLLGSLKDKLLNVSSEVDTKEQIASNIFKKTISGDMIQADVKYQKEAFTFYPIAKYVFSMNQTPVISDKSFAFERRLIIVKFNQTFSGKNADYQLQSKLRKELSGIFNWALMGLNRIMKEYIGISETSQMIADKAIFMQKINPMLVFVDEKCDLNPMNSIVKTELYEEYAKWCDSSGLRKLSRMRFYSQLLDDYSAISSKKPPGAEPREFEGIAMKNFKIV